MRDRTIFHRSFGKSTRLPSAAIMADRPAREVGSHTGGGVGGGGVGGDDCCDPNAGWVRDLVNRARQCDLASRMTSDPNAPIPTCGPGAAAATELAFPASASIAASASSTVTMNVQVNNFMGRRLIVPNSISSYFTIDDVKIGTKSILDSSNPLQAEQFSSLTERGGFLNFLKATAGINISVDFTNIDTSARVFRASIEGAVW